MAIGVDRSHINVQTRGFFAFWVVATIFFLIALRLWYLQILNGDYFKERSENNRIRTVYLPPPRGLILDRNGQIIVKNRASFNIEFIAEDSPNPKNTVERLAQIVGEPFDDMWSRYRTQKKRRRFEPKVLMKDIPRDLVPRITAKRYQLPGVIVNVVPARDYIYGTLGAHVLGYIREITGGQLEKPAYARYMLGDMVGQYGVESQWESELQGKRGMQAIIVDASGNRIGQAASDTAVAGHNITLTIDLDLQKAAEAAMQGKKGAVVAMDVNTGEILTMLSHPAFDPNMFAKEVSAADWNDLVFGSDKKLNNRAMQGTFPPGSVFKIFMSIAALSEGVMTEQSGVSCPGFLHFAGRDYRCHKKAGHGHVQFRDALIQSCDVYYYTAGQRLGIDRIHEYTKKYGLGERTGLELGDEATGLVPSTQWKKSHYKNPANQKWFPGETLSVAIGQGAVTLTPLQITRGLAAIVNGGKLLKPHVVMKIDSPGGYHEGVGTTEVASVSDVEKKVIDKVRDAMEGVVGDPRGTGHRASLEKEFGIKVGGKTGTAQNAGLQHHNKGQFEDHAWFTGYAPADNPEIAVTALVENGGHGGVTAAPVVKEVMMAYFGKKLPRLDTKLLDTKRLEAKPAGEAAHAPEASGGELAD